MPAQRNLISGNVLGVRFLCPLDGGSCNPGSVVQGNLIGTTAGRRRPPAELRRHGVAARRGRSPIGGAYNGREQNVIAGEHVRRDRHRAGIRSPGPSSCRETASAATPAGRQHPQRLRDQDPAATCAGPPCNSALDGPPVRSAAPPRAGTSSQDNAGARDPRHHRHPGHRRQPHQRERRQRHLPRDLDPVAPVGPDRPEHDQRELGARDLGEHDPRGGVDHDPGELPRQRRGRDLAHAGASARGWRATRSPSNGGLGIDLGDDGVTPNDFLDQDAGPNDLMNFPVLTGACTTGGNVVVSGSLIRGRTSTRRSSSSRARSAIASGNGEGAVRPSAPPP